MGLFNFFSKKKEQEPLTAGPDPTITDHNFYLRDILYDRIAAMGHAVEKHPQYLSLTVNSELEIATAIIDDPNNHPAVIHLMTLTIHPLYFPEGIEENLAAIGKDMPEKLSAVIDNYINTTFYPVIDALTDSHHEALDFAISIDGTKTLIHPKPGGIALQGHWTEQPHETQLFDLVKEQLKAKFGTQKLNWLKMYAARLADGKIVSECLFNNTPWEEGKDILDAFARSWPTNGEFQAIKQFIMFRRCDASHH